MMIRDDSTSSGNTSLTSCMNNLGVNTPSKKKYKKKAEPTAPKITRPCSECGKKFWSWKALFGHMRCHPERKWRGINPPPNFTNRHHKNASTSAVTSTSASSFNFLKMTEDDHDAALSLLMLANGFGSANSSRQSPWITTSENVVFVRDGVVISGSGAGGDLEVVPGTSGTGGGSTFPFRFECSSCKKVFGSPQALGGHRATHKNVKSCFASTRNNDGVSLEEELSPGNLENCDGGVVVEEDTDKILMMGLGSGLDSGIQVPQHHQCNICFRGFPTGQALDGHKRCHWEKLDNNNNNNNGSLGINWNLPALTPPTPRIFEGGSSYCLHSTSLEGLALRLGL